MKFKLFLITLFLFCFPIDAYSTEFIDFEKYFSDYKGCFVLYDMKNDTYLIYNKEQAEKRISPCSTFKIFNSLVGLETGVIKDENFVIKWDGVKINFGENWNQDHTLKSAIKYSVLWYYKELARRVGEEKMLYYLNKADYGNEDISGGIDNFWLRSSFKVSAFEQINFLKKFINYNLPFSKRSVDIVKDIIILDKNDKFVLRGKTGSGYENKKWILGWFIGYLETDGNTYIFAVNMEGEDDASGANAKKITYEILKELNLICN